MKLSGHLGVFLVFLFPHLIFAEKEAYKVFRVVPANETQLKFLQRIYESASEYELDFWKGPRAVDAVCDIMVPPLFLHTFPRLLKDQGIHYTITIQDVQKLIEDREKKSKEPSFSPILRDDSSGPRYDFSRYQSFATMRNFMHALVRRHPGISRIIRLGTSHEGRPIEAVKIGNPIGNDQKRMIWVDGGIHAREWAASTVALFFVKELITKYDSDPEIKHHVDHLNWIIVPQVNPDGYEFSRSGKHPNVRLWRKNMSEKQCITNRFNRRKCCRGVDLNRNFDFHWGESGSSRNPCDEIYQGNATFSEPEARAIRDFVSPRKHQIDAFITLHTYAQIWAHAFGHQRREYPADVTDLRRVGLKAAEALKGMYGTEYKVGSGADTLCKKAGSDPNLKCPQTSVGTVGCLDPASGGSDDWAKDVMGIKFVYLLELRPDESEWEGFILDEDKLLPTAMETFVAVKVVAEEVMRRRGIPVFRPSSSNAITSRVVRGRFGGRREGETCLDKRQACHRWVRNNPNLCQSIRHFMGEQCAKSCRLC